MESRSLEEAFVSRTYLQSQERGVSVQSRVYTVEFGFQSDDLRTEISKFRIYRLSRKIFILYTRLSIVVPQFTINL